MADGPDRWHRWLLDVRFGGDAAHRQAELTGFLYPVRDTVLDKAEALELVLSPQEITEFTDHLRPLVESGTGQHRRAVAYLTAVKV